MNNQVLNAIKTAYIADQAVVDVDDDGLPRVEKGRVDLEGRFSVSELRAIVDYLENIQ